MKGIFIKMPKFSLWIILAWVFGMALIIMPFIYSGNTVHAGLINTEYANKLSSACYAGVQAVDNKNKSLVTGGYTGIWNKKQDRDESLNAFYRTLDYSFLLSDSTDDEIEVSVPIVVLVDNDGYYLTSDPLFDDARYSYAEKRKFNNEGQRSEFKTWAGPAKSGWIIRYCLNDYIFLISPKGRLYEGLRTDTDLGNEIRSDSNYTTELGNFLWSDPKYEENKIIKIIDDIQTEMQYYANELNNAADPNSEGYFITMPVVEKEDWHRLLHNPTVLGFLQGKNTKTGKMIVNTYSYSGGEIIPADRYFITESGGKKTYHSLRYESKLGRVSNSGGKYSYNGSEIKRFYPTMRECARKGADACKDCIRKDVQ